MDDLISRQQAIDAIMGEYPDAHYPDWYASKIMALPSAQPEKRTEKRTESHACDLISRQAAIDGKISIQCANGVEIYSDEAVPVEYLKALPSEQPEQKWIPCSERLPEEGQNCLVCDKGSIGIDTYIGHGNPYNWKWYVRDYEAWMPLPEPYTKGDTK